MTKDQWLIILLLVDDLIWDLRDAKLLDEERERKRSAEVGTSILIWDMTSFIALVILSGVRLAHSWIPPR